MSIFKGGLFAGALFAGAFWANGIEAPQPPDTSTGGGAAYQQASQPVRRKEAANKFEQVASKKPAKPVFEQSKATELQAIAAPESVADNELNQDPARSIQALAAIEIVAVEQSSLNADIAAQIEQTEADEQARELKKQNNRNRAAILTALLLR
jgi:hypothetical protein